MLWDYTESIMQKRRLRLIDIHFSFYRMLSTDNYYQTIALYRIQI